MGIAALQARLEEAWRANQPDVDVDHVLVVLPSHSVAESLLAHYAARVPAMEHRYLVALLLLRRLPHCEMVFVCSQEPGPEVLAYYTAIAGLGEAGGMVPRFRTVVVADRSARALSAKLLDRPDLIDELRASFRGRPVFVQPWNVTDLEVEVALRLQAPLHGTLPQLWPLGFKSAGRRLFGDAGVPLPYGFENLRSLDEVVTAAAAVQSARPAATGVVVKHDNSCAGDGNAVIGLRSTGGGSASAAEIRERVAALPEWYLADVRRGAVVEELISGDRLPSPSVQLHLAPTGDVRVLATHEQVLGGDSEQVFTGCRFPADPAYAPEIARYGQLVGEQLTRRGAVGRVSMDFIVGRDADGQQPYALELNLRNGGTTHPYAVLRNLVPGCYDTDTGRWLTEDGSPRCYSATDNVVDTAWLGLPPATVIDAVARAGLQFDLASGTGVVLHMLSCLAIDGRFGLTAIGTTPEHAAQLHAATRDAVAGIKRPRAAR